MSAKSTSACGSIRPGQVWLDTSGKRIQAHGGSIIAEGDAFYWYGENKEKTRPGAGIWHYGVRMYKSKDMYNWEDLGLVLPPVLDDPKSPLHPAQCMDRPHIVYCRRTGKFVLWMKIMDVKGCYVTVAIADKVSGPYAIIGRFQPMGMSCGDFDLDVEPTDGKAYYFFERVHSEMICADMTDDYTGLTGYYSTHFPRVSPPSVREAPAYFRRGRLHYLITSGTTGYFPNPSEVACSMSYHGPWKVLGDPHPGDVEHVSFRSQISSVFKHPGRKNLYIALADRWLTDLPEKLPDIGAVYRSIFDSDEPDWTRHKQLDVLTAQNTSLSDYVWLPIRFDGEMAIIDWHDEWRIEDYE